MRERSKSRAELFSLSQSSSQRLLTPSLYVFWISIGSYSAATVVMPPPPLRVRTLRLNVRWAHRQKRAAGDRTLPTADRAECSLPSSVHYMLLQTLPTADRAECSLPSSVHYMSLHRLFPLQTELSAACPLVSTTCYCRLFPLQTELSAACPLVSTTCHCTDSSHCRQS
uniref:Uncharacterized protein n=1 Tax=Knipowitschia caucasica TaxID=637954 RepID=A0AAV2JLT1_KNICA